MEAVETAMGEPYGRGWLDLQRYAWKACYEQGSYYEPISTAVRSETRALLADYPTLPEMTLADDTPTANAETVAWINEYASPGTAAPAAAPSYEPPPPPPSEDEDLDQGEGRQPDAFDLAMQSVRDGDFEGGIGILAREAALERSARARFQRKVQLAQLCLSANHAAIAHPILKELAAEIDRRSLENWESAETLAHPLVLLYHCLGKIEGASEEEKQKLYARICCLDPVQALACSR
jgi:type VI secretion system protein ImpA